MAYFVFNEPAMDFEFHQWEGMLGRHIRLKSEVLSELARGSCGVDTGLLKASIGTEYGRTTGGDLESKVGVTGSVPQIGYAYFHHEGTKPHEIHPRFKKALKFTTHGFTVFARRVYHPGTWPTKYLTRHLRFLF